jgi:hypothetical protein
LITASGISDGVIPDQPTALDIFQFFFSRFFLNKFFLGGGGGARKLGDQPTNNLILLVFFTLTISTVTVKNTYNSSGVVSLHFYTLEHGDSLCHKYLIFTGF